MHHWSYLQELNCAPAGGGLLPPPLPPAPPKPPNPAEGCALPPPKVDPPLLPAKPPNVPPPALPPAACPKVGALLAAPPKALDAPKAGADPKAVEDPKAGAVPKPAEEPKAGGEPNAGAAPKPEVGLAGVVCAGAPNPWLALPAEKAPPNVD